MVETERPFSVSPRSTGSITPAKLKLARIPCAELPPTNKRLHVRPLFVVFLVLLFQQFFVRSEKLFKRVEVSSVEEQFLVVEVGDVGADLVQDISRVRDHHDSGRIGLEKFGQPGDCMDIKMIRGLIEQEDLGGVVCSDIVFFVLYDVSGNAVSLIF